MQLLRFFDFYLARISAVHIDKNRQRYGHLNQCIESIPINWVKPEYINESDNVYCKDYNEEVLDQSEGEPATENQFSQNPAS